MKRETNWDRAACRVCAGDLNAVPFIHINSSDALAPEILPGDLLHVDPRLNFGAGVIVLIERDRGEPLLAMIDMFGENGLHVSYAGRRDVIAYDTITRAAPVVAIARELYRPGPAFFARLKAHQGAQSPTRDSRS